MFQQPQVGCDLQFFQAVVTRREDCGPRSLGAAVREFVPEAFFGRTRKV